jgi:hypothetical protein
LSESLILRAASRTSQTVLACLMGVIFSVVIPWRHVVANHVRRGGDRWRRRRHEVAGGACRLGLRNERGMHARRAAGRTAQHRRLPGAGRHAVNLPQPKPRQREACPDIHHCGGPANSRRGDRPQILDIV